MKIVKDEIAFVQISDVVNLKGAFPETINVDKISKMANEGEKDFFVAFARSEEIKFFKESNIPEYDSNTDDNSVAKVLSK